MDNNEQPTGYSFDVEGKLLKEHECPICLMLIRNATELPCTHLMCRDCLVHFEEKELERNENADFLCSLCQQGYHKYEKKEVRSHDRIIRESLEVKCKNWEDGCDWVGSISYYEDHHINACKFLMVKCSNNGCKGQMQRSEILRHQETCKYRIVSCEHCQGEFSICWLKDHHETCPSYPVACQNSGCDEFVPQNQMKDHWQNECQYQVIPCIYSEIGCTIQVPRNAMAKHHHEAMQHHSFLLLKSHVALSKNNQDLENRLKKSNETIEQLQETVMKQEESIERQQAEITCLQNDVKTQEELKVKEKLTNLETFAEQSANFSKMISEKDFFHEPLLSVLYQKDYDNNERLKKYKNRLKEMKNKETDCCYLQTLGKAVQICHERNFSTKYVKRLQLATCNLKKDVLYRRDNVTHLRTNSFPCKSIIFNVCNNYSLFEEKMKKSLRLNYRSQFFASYYDKTEGCYYIEYLEEELTVNEVKLLHKSNEKEIKKLDVNCQTLIEWTEFNLISSFVFQIEKF